jgi:SAM-dependent MidA family methyltransferase
VVELITWRAATQRALYGRTGFYRNPAGPAAHFRTSVTASSLFAEAVARLLVDVDRALGHPDPLDVVDVGAGHAHLLRWLQVLAPAPLSARLRLVAVERAPRPPGVPGEIVWLATLPRRVRGLLVANEWLDTVPVDVVRRTEEGLRVVLVDPATGEERDGPRPSPPDAGWISIWWPLTEAGHRAEVGRPRDRAWGGAVACLEAGVAVAVDYAHDREERVSGRLQQGTLTGYRGGRGVPAVPDGSCDVTSHVALDSCAAAAAAGAGGVASVLTTQREALARLGVDSTRPAYAMARADPTAYLRALQRTGEAAEITARGGLGDFGWLVQSVGIAMPAVLDGAGLG